MEQVIGFIGAGQMAAALAGGFVRAGLVNPEQIVAHDPSTTAVEHFVGQVPGCRTLASNAEVLDAADVIFLAVKPQTMAAVMEQTRGWGSDGKLLVSIAAGIPLASLTAGFDSERIIRVMPNTPCLVGRGAAGFALGPAATAEDGRLVASLLESVGVAFEVDERLLDAVTGLSGSGPAFVYMVIEALSDGGVRMGLPRAIATQLAAQTVQGAAAMVLASQEHPAVLKDRVASPAGTTIAGMQALEEHGLRAALIAAVETATERSIQLGAK
jgi:pyrroline-5-carboxylate reductase